MIRVFGVYAEASQIREAMKDDVIPLATPIVLNSGKTVSSIKIRKGQLVRFLPSLRIST